MYKNFTFKNAIGDDSIKNERKNKSVHSFIKNNDETSFNFKEKNGKINNFLPDDESVNTNEYDS